MNRVRLVTTTGATPRSGTIPSECHPPIGMPPDSPDQLTAYLHRSIPLTAVMGIRAVETSWEAAVLAAPYEDNINHEGTLFGGSLSALALLTGFAVLRHRLQVIGHLHRIVIQRNTYSYQRPATTDATARAAIGPSRWKELLDNLERRGKARIIVEVEVSDTSLRPVGHLTGTFALLPAGGQKLDLDESSPT